MRFQILIATMEGAFFEHNIDVPSSYLVVNQYKNTPFENQNTHNYNEAGLSKSRNHALALSQGEISLISDDDIAYIQNIEQTILDAFEKNPDADIITFQIQTPQGEPYKRYKQKSFWHTPKTLMGVCSVEIAFKTTKIREKALFFDEAFGLGATFPTGEENIFLTDALKKGLKILYLPIPIVIHPSDSSGMHYNNSTLTQAKGAMFYRIFGIAGYGISILFAYKKYKESKYTLKQFIAIMFQGIKAYRSYT